MPVLLLDFSYRRRLAVSFFLVHWTKRPRMHMPGGYTDHFYNLMTKFTINNRTDAWKTRINLLNRFHVALRLISSGSQKTSKSGKKISDTLGCRLVCQFCSNHILMSSVINYWTNAQQHGIYLFFVAARNVHICCSVITGRAGGYVPGISAAMRTRLLTVQCIDKTFSGSFLLHSHVQ